MLRVSFIAVIGAICTIGHAAVADPVRITDNALLGLIRQAEANGSYNIVYGGLREQPPEELTSMTVADVIAWQRGLGRVTSTASGGYQFIRTTLAETARNAGIAGDQLFDEATQDALAMHKVDECKASAGAAVVSFGNCLAAVWAAFPLLSGPHRGQSRHRNIANNRARLTAEDFESALTSTVSTVTIDGESYALEGERGHEQPVRVVTTELDRYQQIKSAMSVARSVGGIGRSVHERPADG